MGGERRRRGRAAEPRAQSQADEEPEAQIQADEEPEEQCSSLRGSEDKRGEEREGYSSRRKIGNWRRNARRSVKVDFYHRLHVIFSNTAIAWQLPRPAVLRVCGGKDSISASRVRGGVCQSHL